VPHGEHHAHCHHSESHTTGDVDEPLESIDEEVLTRALDALSKEFVWRVKGLVRLTGKGMHILNWAFGRFELTLLKDDSEKGTVKLTVSPTGCRNER
jgi:G3E family GTPase